MSLRILIIDDHPLILDGLKQLIAQNGNFEVVDTILSWSDLLTALNESYDILILDLNIQGRSSLKRISEITSKQPSLKILIYTSYNEVSLVRKAFEHDVKGYILKDTSQEELIEALKTIVSGKTYIGKKVAIPKRGLEHLEIADDFQDDFIKKASLTKREQEIMHAIIEGLENQAIADKLFISIHTVQTHRKRIFKKLGVHKAAELVKLAMKKDF